MLGQFQGAIILLPNRHNFLHQTNSISLLRIKHIAREQVIHRITPSCSLGNPERRTAGSVNTSRGFELRKPTVVGSNDNIAG